MFSDAVRLMFASYYCLNISYPADQGATLEFVERCLFKINPEKGSKIEKRTSRNHRRKYSTHLTQNFTAGKTVTITAHRSAVKIFAGCRDPDGPRAQELHELAQKHKDVITVVKLDIGSSVSITEAAKLVENEVQDKGLNLIINNAGVNIPGSLADTEKSTMVDVYTTNVVGPMIVAKDFRALLCKAAAQFSHQTSMSCKRSAIINVSTLLSSITICPENFSLAPMYPYRVSKAALNMLTRCLAEDLKNDGILVMALHPGWVQTEMGGSEAPLTAAESVKGMLEVIANLTEKETGTLLDWKGNSIPW